jgi:membrane protease YdiL (CAAX protease family)
MSAQTQDYSPTYRHRFARLIAIVLVLYVLPITLVCAGVVPFEYRNFILVAMAGAAGLLSWAKHTHASRGWRSDNLLHSLRLNGIFLLFTLFVLAICVLFEPIRRLPHPPGAWFGIFYVLVSCPAQEFLFRSFLWAELRSARSDSRLLEFTLLVIPYTLIHWVYKDPVTMVLTFGAGVAWYLIYRRAPNWFGVTLAHSAAGLSMIILGFV